MHFPAGHPDWPLASTLPFGVPTFLDPIPAWPGRTAATWPTHRRARGYGTISGVDRDTVAVYEQNAAEWRSRRGDRGDGLGAQFRAAAGPGPVADLGCGVGRYLPEIGEPVIGLDATAAMLGQAGAVLAEAGLAAGLVRGDLEALPLADSSLVGLFARHSYLHLPKARLVPALAEARRVIMSGGIVFLSLIPGDYEGRSLPQDDFPGRYFALWSEAEVVTALEEAGFRDPATELRERSGGRQSDLLAWARR